MLWTGRCRAAETSWGSSCPSQQLGGGWWLCVQWGTGGTRGGAPEDLQPLHSRHPRPGPGFPRAWHLRAGTARAEVQPQMVCFWALKPGCWTCCLSHRGGLKETLQFTWSLQLEGMLSLRTHHFPVRQTVSHLRPGLRQGLNSAPLLSKQRLWESSFTPFTLQMNFLV